MKNKNKFLIAAGVWNFLVALMHTFGGQLDLVNPMLESNLSLEVKTILLGAWHIVTIFLFCSAFVLLYFGLKTQEKPNLQLIGFINYQYILYSIGFIAVSLIYGILAPQWILLFPIAVLGMIGIRKHRSNP